jgi:hypothetical protein
MIREYFVIKPGSRTKACPLQVMTFADRSPSLQCFRIEIGAHATTPKSGSKGLHQILGGQALIGMSHQPHIQLASKNSDDLGIR